MTISIQTLCAVISILLAAMGVAKADDPDVMLWIGWSVLYFQPISDEEKKHNIRHETWTSWSLSKSEAECEETRAYGKPAGNEERICKPIGLSKDDFDRDSHSTVCSQLQSKDMALYTPSGSYEPLVSMCDLYGIDREWISRGVEWYEAHPLTQLCTTWWKRNRPTFGKVTGYRITQEGTAHASTAQSVSAVRSEVDRRAKKTDLLPAANKVMSAEDMKSWQSREAGKQLASNALRAMNDQALESWVDAYCADNPGDTLRDAGLALFSELRRPK